MGSEPDRLAAYCTNAEFTDDGNSTIGSRGMQEWAIAFPFHTTAELEITGAPWSALPQLFYTIPHETVDSQQLELDVKTSAVDVAIAGAGRCVFKERMNPIDLHL